MPRMPNQPISARCWREVREPRQADRHRQRPDHQQQQRHEPPAALLPVDRPQQHADHHHGGDLADALDLLVEAQHRVGHEGRCVPRIGRASRLRRARRQGRHRPRLRSAERRPAARRASGSAAGSCAAAAATPRGLAPLDPAQGHAGREHGEEAVAVDQHRGAVGQARSGRGRGSCRGRPPPCARGAGRAPACRPRCRAPRRCRARQAVAQSTSTASQRQPKAPSRAGRAGRGRA